MVFQAWYMDDWVTHVYGDRNTFRSVVMVIAVVAAVIAVVAYAYLYRCAYVCIVAGVLGLQTSAH